MELWTNGILPLVGVCIGGLISYFAQQKHQSTIELRKDKRLRLIAYNVILSNEGENSPLVYPIHEGTAKGFNWDTYKKVNRKILYENLHLFDYNIAVKVLNIDDIAEKCEYFGPEQHDIEELFDLYIEIIKWVREDYKKQITET